jgi:thymidylate kinase
MFIVEGLDYAGKTTVLDTLQRKVRQQRWDRWYVGGKQISELQRWGKLPADFEYCEQYIVAANGAQLCDRFVLSELAYGEVFRGGANAKFDSHARRRVQRELNLLGSVTLLVKCDWESTESRARQRCLSEFDAAMKVRQTFDAGTAAFQTALKDLALGRRGGSFLGEYDSSARHCYDYMSKGESTGDAMVKYKAAVDDVLEWYLLQWKMHLERSSLVMRKCPQGTGYLWPRIVFVGENINHPTSQRPFDGKAGASRTMTELLDMADIGEKEVFFWNAYTYRGNQLASKEGIALLAPKVVVAMGKEAHEHLVAIGVKHVEFPHPQWIGRFHRGDMMRYAGMLKHIKESTR